MILTSANILETYPDCVECNRLCYRLVDCETGDVTHYSEDPSWATYVGKILRWTTQAIIDAGTDPIEYNCSRVEAYTCRLETYTTLIPDDIVIESCYRTCDECEPFDPVEPEEEIVTGRTVQPGYDVPGCSRTPKTCA